MPLVINTNIAALRTQRSLVAANRELERASERLASGVRINYARDDAAGSAISSRLTSQLRGMQQAVRNANDGISLLQTADGAIEQSDQILQRLRELAIQSANGIYTDSDRMSLDAEAQQLTQELDRIAKATTFNNRPLLDGSFGTSSLQVGENAGDRLDIQLPSLASDSLGLGGNQASTLIGSSLVLSGNNTLASAIKANHVLINGQDLGDVAAGTRLDDLLAHINYDMHGISASTLVELEGSQAGTGVLGSGDSLTLSISHLDGTTSTLSVSNTSNLQELAEAITRSTGGQVQGRINGKGFLSLSATNIANLAVSDSTGSASGLGGGSINGGSVHQSVINGLTSYWIKEAETLISTHFGLSAPANTEIDLLFAETDGSLTGDVSGLSPAQQTSLASDGPNNGIASVWSDPANLKLTVDMADFVTPEGSPWLYNDRVIAHEMVHAVMAASVSSGINNSLPGWFSEGIAEFIHGADERVLGDIQANTPPASSTSVGIAAVAGALKTTPGSPSSSLGYSPGYSAVRMLHDEILAHGGAGLSDVLTALAGGTSLTAAINAATGSSLGAFESHFAAHGDEYLSDALNGTNTYQGVSLNGASSHMNLNDANTGSIAGSDYGGASLSAASVLLNTASGGPINFSLKLPDGYSASSTGASAKLVLNDEFGSPATVTLGVEGSLVDLANLGFRQTQAGVIEGVGISNPDTAWSPGQISINGVTIDNTDTASLSGKLAAINKATAQTGVRAELTTNALLDLSHFDYAHWSTTNYGDFTLNGTVVTGIGNASNLAAMADTFNSFTKTTGVSVTISGNNLRMSSTRGIVFGSHATLGPTAAEAFGASNAGRAAILSSASEAANGAAVGVTAGTSIDPGIRLVSLKKAPIALELGTTAGSTTGWLEVNASSAGAGASPLTSLSLRSQSAATSALLSIDAALAQTSQTRAALGAWQNRLDFTTSRLMNSIELSAAARARIEDADYAGESARLSRAQILVQASTAMLAQANARPQQVLSLLR